jgi:hypothetical protein
MSEQARVADNILVSNPNTTMTQKEKSSSQIPQMSRSNPEDIDLSNYHNAGGLALGSIGDSDLFSYFATPEEGEEHQPTFHNSYLTGEVGEHVDEMYEDDELFIKPQIQTQEQRQRALLQSGAMRPINDDRTAFEKKRGLNMDPKHVIGKYYQQAFGAEEQDIKARIFGQSKFDGNMAFGVPEEYARKAAASGKTQFSGIDQSDF